MADRRGFSTEKGQALLAYLALDPECRASRIELATLLWGDRFDEQARASLRQCLFELRKAMPDIAHEILSADGEMVVLDGQAITIDVREFERLAVSVCTSLAEIQTYQATHRRHQPAGDRGRLCRR